MNKATADDSDKLENVNTQALIATVGVNAHCHSMMTKFMAKHVAWFCQNKIRKLAPTG